MRIGYVARVLARPLVKYRFVCGFVAILLVSAVGMATATARAGAAPPWNKGIQPVTPESYYHAIE